MEIALMGIAIAFLAILVMGMAFVIGNLWSKVKVLENKPESKNNKGEILNEVDKYLTRKFMEFGRDIDKRLEKDRVDLDELRKNTEKRTRELYDFFKEAEQSQASVVTKEIDRLQVENKKYTDSRIDFLNKKFFTVINLDDK